MSCRLPGRLVDWKQTMLVLSWPVGGGMAAPWGATSTKRVTLSSWSSMRSACTDRPYSDAARRVPMAATVGSPRSATTRAASAVDEAAPSVAPGRLAASHPRHWATAWGNDSTSSHLLRRRARHGQEVLGHRQDHLADDAQVLLEHQVVER